MKLICPRCKALFENLTNCPDCKKSPLREPEANEPVLAGRVDYLRAEMLKPLFKQENIPTSFEGGISSALGMNIGMRLDVIRVLVPYPAYERAQEILEFLSGSYTEDDNPVENEEAQK